MKGKKVKSFLFGFLLVTIISITVVTADSIFTSSDITYDNSKSNLTSTNVKDAIDEIYNKSYEKKRIKAYTYSETGDNLCINGEEKTCVETKCYENKTAGSCVQGTIIKYYVNDNEQKVFYVLHDDGATITMQQRENTVRNIAWYADSIDSTKGPTTILQYLEAATATWTNVEFQEYTAGYTNLFENAYTGCTYSTSDYKITCNVNTYNGDSANLTLAKRKVRARMITAQEASSAGCLVIRLDEVNDYNRGTCPDWMHNYLYQSTSFGGSYEDNTVNENGVYNYNYWTMSADSDYSLNAWLVDREGYFAKTYTSDAYYGARAVVVIKK